jgi:hypothetical protein
MWTLCEIMRIFDRRDVEERELPPLPPYQTAFTVVAGVTHSWRKRCRRCGRRLGRRCRGCGRKHEMRSQRAALGFGSASLVRRNRTFPRPSHNAPPHSDLASSTSTTNSTLNGILWSPQVAHPRKCEISCLGDQLAALPARFFLMLNFHEFSRL